MGRGQGWVTRERDQGNVGTLETQQPQQMQMSIAEYLHLLTLHFEISICLHTKVPKVSHNYSTYWEWWCCAIPTPGTSNNSDNNSSIVTTGSVSGTATVCTLHTSVAFFTPGSYLHIFISSYQQSATPHLPPPPSVVELC